MTYALGFRVKSGRAIAVALAGAVDAPCPLVCATVALSDPSVAGTTQPYHAGFGSAQEDQETIDRLIAAVERSARRSIADLLGAKALDGSSCRGARLVVGSVIDPDTVGNPHIRAHAREGRLFRVVIEDALRSHQVRCSVVIEKALAGEAQTALRRSEADIRKQIGELGRALGGPWRADEKAAATAAWIELA